MSCLVLSCLVFVLNDGRKHNKVAGKRGGGHPLTDNININININNDNDNDNECVLIIIVMKIDLLYLPHRNINNHKPH